MRRLTLPVGLVLLAALATPAQARAQARPRPEPSTPAAQQPPPSPSVPLQTQADDYTRYELLEPASHAFRILYDVTATTPGATQFLNGIRIGSEAKVDAVYDRMSGEKLPFDVVPGSEARANGLPDAPLEERFIRVRLARPVPADGGEARLRIDKTYTDSASYGGAAETLVFRRSLSIKRNAVVLPPGWELVGVNYPSQVATESDGRIRVSFWNAGPAAVPYEVRARALPPAAVAAATAKAAPPLRDDVAPPAPRPTPSTPGAPAPAPTGASAATGAPAAPAAAGAPAGGGRARVAYVVPERASQDREIVYYLQQPETHAFRLYHDYTESRAGVDRYVNVVRAGSRSSDPAARILDTGRVLEVETLRGAAIVGRKIDIGEEIGPETEIVVAWFDAVKPGESVRLRIEETYTDPGRYRLSGDELVWDRAFGRPKNTVVLPPGWYLTASSIPAVVGTLPDGRVRLELVNDRPDEIQVFVKARRRRP